jgi:hypothetical protein
MFAAASHWRSTNSHRIRPLSWSVEMAAKLGTAGTETEMRSLSAREFLPSQRVYGGK